MKNIERKLKNLIDHRKSKDIIKSSIKEIEFRKRSAWQFVASALFAMVLAICIGFSKNTVELSISLIELINGAMIAFVAMILSSYSIFQALLNKDLVKLIFESDDSEEGLLVISNRSFLNLTILYVTCIVFNLFLLGLLRCITTDFIFLNLCAANILASVLLFAYLFYCYVILLEVINFTINLYKMFCLYNTLKVLDAIADNEERESD